jgi:MFS family permease
MNKTSIYTRDFILLILATFLFFSSFYLIMPILPLYVKEQGGFTIEVGLVVGAFALSSTVFRFLVGGSIDKKGRKRFLLLGAANFSLSALLYNLLPTTNFLLLLRLFHGIGIACYTTSSITLAADLAPRGRRGETLGVYGVAQILAMALAPALGTFVHHQTNYRTAFSLGAVAALASWLLVIRMVEPPRETASTAVNGFWSEMKAMELWSPYVCILMIAITYGLMVTFLPLLALERGITSSYIGLFFTFYAVATFSLRLIAGKASDRFGRRVVLIPALLTLSLAMVAIGQIHTVGWMLLSALLYGVGFGTTSPTLMALMVDQTHPQHRGAAVGLYAASFESGVIIGSVLLGLVGQTWGLTFMFWFGAVLVLLGLIPIVTYKQQAFSS